MLTLSLLLPLAYIFYIANLMWSFHDPAFAIGLGIVIALELSIIIGVQWKWKRDEARQLAADIASADPTLVERLQKLVLGLAAVNERASSELFLRFKTLPEGISIITRRIHLDTLRGKGVWDDLPLRVRTWLMRPDGGWPPEVAMHVRGTEEKLHTLLWALAMTKELRPLEQMEKPIDFAALEKLLMKPAPGIRPTWDLRTERNKAQPYFYRLFAESVHRGQREAESEKQAKGVEDWMAAIAEGEADNLSGARTISELDNEALNHIARSAAFRFQVLSMLLDSLYTNQRWDRFAARLFNALPSTGRLSD